MIPVIYEKITDRSIRTDAVSNIIASDGKETRIKISEEKFDIILLNVQLPDMDGYELIRTRTDGCSKNQETPIVVFSARTGMTNETTRSCGSRNFLGKPFLPDDLLLKIQRFVKSN